MADLKPTKPLSGFIELLPAQQRCFDACVARMRDVLARGGFANLDLPAIERAEVLTDKDNWDEIETQMFLFDKGDTKMGLRYDGTIGLARYVAGHLNDLAFPFFASQFGKRYRGERPQKGRYREFYQLDLDILGVGQLSQNYDAEIIATVAGMFAAIKNTVGGVTIRVGNRPFWNAVFDWVGIRPDTQKQLLILIDKKNKLSESDFRASLLDMVPEKAANEILGIFSDGYSSLLKKNDKIDAAVSNLNQFMTLLADMGVKNAVFDASIVRGLGYYTGNVFEVYLDKYTELGSVCGGGRYDDLAGKFSKTKIQGVGCAAGVSRMLVALMDSGAIDLTPYENSIDAVVLVMGDAQIPFAASAAAQLRDAGIVAVTYLDTEKKFKNQIEYADKIKAKFSVIVGPDEAAAGMVALKNMTTGEQETVAIADAIKKIL